MRRLKQELEKDVRQQGELLERYRKELRAMPQGSLVQYQKKGRKYYKHIVYMKGRDGSVRRMDRHLRKTEENLILALQRKAYLKEAIRRMKQNMQIEPKLEKTYLPYDFYSVCDALGEAYQPKTMEEFFRQEGIPLAPVPEAGQLYKPEGLKQQTSGGFLTRSKGEALIAEALMARRIVFQFEGELKVRHPDGRTITLHPDFRIPLRDGRVMLWEHLGLLSDWGYAADTGERLFLYAQKGYYPGINLILTADNSAGYTDMHAAAQILDWLETVCLFQDIPQNS